MCIDCCEPHDSPKNCCDACREKRNAIANEKYHYRKENGLCSNCNTPRMEGHAYCESCSEKYRKRYQRDNPNHVIWRPGKAGRPPKWAVQKVLDLLDRSQHVDDLVKKSGMSRTTIYTYKKKREAAL